MQCPSCGGDIQADQRFAHMVVCRYCDAAIVLDEKAARVSGKMAVLAQTPGPLYVGATGSLDGRQISVLGRVRYGYAKGYWDEWYLSYEDGETFWISEDESNFTLETLLDGSETVPVYAGVSPGDWLSVGDDEFHVDEKDVAECEGGEGQLPFAVLSGEKVPFLDLSKDDAFATIEYELDGSPRVFLGKRFNISRIKLDLEKDEFSQMEAATALRAEREGRGRQRERVVKSADRSVSINCSSCAAPMGVPPHGATSLQCNYCGAVVDLTLRRVACPECQAAITMEGGNKAKSARCLHCDAVLDVSRDEPTLLGTLANKRGPRVPFTLGQSCRFDDDVYRYVGHVRYVSRDAWGVYPSDEFLLYSRKQGYRWLIMENGHFMLSTELDERFPGIDPRSRFPKAKINALGQQWIVFENGKHDIAWVDGELSWVAQVGDKTGYMDAISPPYMLSAEWTETEMEWSQAVYLTREEVADAFEMEASDLPAPTGVGACQPYDASGTRSSWMVASLIATLAFGALMVMSFMKSGSDIGRMLIQNQHYKQEYVTDSFTVQNAPTLCKAVFDADVNNSWVYLDLALIDEQDRALLDFSAQVSYYHGVEGGESWSEGSRSRTKVFRVEQPGTYRFLVLGESDHGHDVTVSLYEGVELARYYVAGLAGCGAIAFCLVVTRAGFEQKRWGEEDDDDD